MEDAVEKAAELAGLKYYEVEEIEREREHVLYVTGSELAANSTTLPSFYYLYIKLGE